MKPSQWFAEFLHRRNLPKPSGDPLYQYRLAESEYDSLLTLLKTSAVFDLKTAQTVVDWDVIFVLYASEWIRRNYVGSWGWGGVFKSIGFDHTTSQTGIRNKFVEDGLRKWGRPVREMNGSRRFLGTVLTEGGLPLNQLKNGSWITNVLVPSLETHIRIGADLSNQVNNRIELIPSSFQSEGLTTMLVEICKIVVKLREDYKLAGQSAPWLVLDKADARWRERFPLPLNDDQAERLLTVLLSVASKKSDDSSESYNFEQVTELRNVGIGQPEVVTIINNPQFLTLDIPELRPLEEVATTQLTIDLMSVDKETITWCKAIRTQLGNDKNALKVLGKPKLLTGNAALSEYSIVVRNFGQKVAQLPIANSMVLPPEQPWLFYEKNGKHILKGVASQRIDAASVYIYAPENAILSFDCEDKPYDECAELFGGLVYKLRGTVECKISDAKYRLSSTSSNVSSGYALLGDLLDIASVPKETFVGSPKAIQVREDGLRINSCEGSLVLEAKLSGSSAPWRQAKDLSTGVYEIRLLDSDGFTLLRRRIGVLPKSFSYSADPDEDSPLRGTIILKGSRGVSSAFGEHVVNKGVVELGPDEVKIQLEAKDQPPRLAQIELQCAHSHKSLRLAFPFPSRGLLLFDETERRIPLSSRLNVNRLAGYRLSLFVGNFSIRKYLYVNFALVDPTLPADELKELRISDRLRVENNHIEFKIMDWSDSINSLLAFSQHIDSHVEIEIDVSGISYEKISVRRYRNDLNRDLERGELILDGEALASMSDDELEGTTLCCMRINLPHENSATLEPLRSGETHTGAWDFKLIGRKSGPWLVYPELDSRRQFRPLYWNIEGESVSSDSNQSTLTAAVCIEPEVNRMTAIDAVLASMALNPAHPSWSYLDDLWEKTAHLPMSTFDVWRVGSRNKQFLTSLQFRGNQSICLKLETDFSISWEAINFDDWSTVLNTQLSCLDEQLNDRKLAREIMVKKIEAIDVFNDALQGMKLHFLTLCGQPEALESKIFHSNYDEYRLLMIKDQSQRLILRHANSLWPRHLNMGLRAACLELPGSYHKIINSQNRHQESVLYLPIVLAFSFARPDLIEMSLTQADQFKINRLKQFDQDWFSIVFKLVSGNLIANLHE